MVTFTEIKCVEKTDGLIIGIYGTLAPQSTYGVPTKARLRAIEEARGPLFYKGPNTEKELLIEFKSGKNGTKSFFLPHPDGKPDNFLETFPECLKNSERYI